MKKKIDDLNLNLSISRIRSEKDYIEVTIQDDDSNSRLSIRLDLANFAECVTGLACVHGKGYSLGIENIGKVMEVDTLVFPLTKESDEDAGYYNRKEVAAREVEKHLPKGWVADKKFNSRDSFFVENGIPHARTKIRRWVEKDS